jgi:Bacterial SH3 domain
VQSAVQFQSRQQVPSDRVPGSSAPASSGMSEQEMSQVLAYLKANPELLSTLQGAQPQQVSQQVPVTRLERPRAMHRPVQVPSIAANPQMFQLYLVGIIGAIGLGLVWIVSSSMPNAQLARMAAQYGNLAAENAAIAKTVAENKDRPNVVDMSLIRWGGGAERQESTASAAMATYSRPPVQAVQETAIVNVDAAGLNIRDRPSVEGSRVLNTIPNGDTVKILQREGEWVRVEWFGVVGNVVAAGLQ